MNHRYDGRPFVFYNGRFSRWALLHLPDKFYLFLIFISILYTNILILSIYFSQIFEKFLEFPSLSRLSTINVELYVVLANITIALEVVIRCFNL